MYNRGMNDDQFDRLYTYMQQEFTAIRADLANTATKDSVEHLVNTMDDFIRRITDSEDEQAARDAQWNRLVEWAREVAKKTGVPLPDL